MEDYALKIFGGVLHLCIAIGLWYLWTGWCGLPGPLASALVVIAFAWAVWGD